jgi:cytochrome c-type biogenesis protein CcmH
VRARPVAAACLLLLALAAAIAAPPDLESAAKAIERKLMAPCCMTNTVDVHESPVAHQMRREIREMLAEGRSEAEILDVYVERYGTQVLAVPRARGFSLMTYLFPLVFVVLVGIGLFFMLRRWRASESEDETEEVPPEPTGPYAERLKRELERFD